MKDPSAGKKLIAVSIVQKMAVALSRYNIKRRLGCARGDEDGRIGSHTSTQWRSIMLEAYWLALYCNRRWKQKITRTEARPLI